MKKSKLALRESQLKWGSSLTGMCQIIVLASILGSYVITLYLLCFDNRIVDNLVPIITLYIFDGIYLLDSLYRIYLTHKDTSFHSIAKVNQKSRARWSHNAPMFIDILSLIPGEALIFLWNDGRYPYEVTSPSEHMARILFLLACFRTNRILRLFRILVYYRNEAKKFRLNLYEKELRAIIVSFLGLVVVLFHGIASAWYTLSCDPVYTDEPPKCVNSFDIRNVTGYHPFYRHINTSIPDAWGRYVGALHWSVMTIKNSGNYYIVPVTMMEFCTAIAVMFAGFFLASFIICMAIYVMGQLDLCRSIYFHEALGVTNFVSHLKMDGNITEFLYDCFNQMWLKERAFTDDTMKKLLPTTLRIEISMSIFQPMVEASEFLKTLRREALEALSLKVEMKYCFPHEFIIRPHTVGYTMFYIVEGNVEVISNEDYKPILGLSKGSLIGECNLIIPTYREHGVKTSTTCEVLKLTWSSLTSVIALDPNARDQIHEIMKKRIKWPAHQRRKKVSTIETKLSNFQDPRSTFLAELAVRDVSVSRSASSKQLIDSPVSSGGSIDSQGYRTKAPLMIRQNLATPGLESTQFMSLFTWLRFHKREQYNDITATERLEFILNKMEKKLRNEASRKSYQVLRIATNPLYYWPYCAISRETYTFMFWDFFVNFGIIFNTIAYPVQLVLADDSISQELFVAIDVIYIADLIFRLFVFRDRSEMAPLATMTEHFFNEAGTTNIWFDIVPIFPLHNIAFIVMTQYGRTYLYLRMHMLCKFGKLILRFQKWEHDVTKNTTAIRILKHGIFIITLIVFVACNFAQRRCEKDGYGNCVFEDNSTYRIDRDRYNFENGSIFEILLYWAVCVTFGIGFTDVTTETRAETTIHTVALLIGFFFVVYCCSDLAATLASAIENKINHQDNTIWLHRYLDETLTEVDLIARVDRYMDVQWLVLRGINADTATRSVGFLSVSHSMYSDLMVHIMAECLYQTDLFKLLDAELVRKFCLTARLSVVPPNEVILSYGDFVRRMYVIRRGSAEAVLLSNGKHMGILTKGQSIGFGELIYGLRSKIQVTSLTYLEVIIIEGISFDEILGNSKAFEEIWDRIKSDQGAMEIYSEHFRLHEERKYSSHEADYLNASKEVFVYHRVLRRFREKKDTYLEEWRRLGKFRWCRFLMCPCTFLPTSKLLRIWEGFRVLTIILMIFWLPVLEAFPYLKQQYGPFVYVTDAVTIVDMFFRLHIAYYDSKTTDLVTHPVRSAKHYLSTGFLADVIGGPAVYFVIDNLFKTYTSHTWDTSIYAFLLRMNRLILMYHIYGVYKFTDKHSAFSNGQNARRVVKLLPLFFFHAHMMACAMAVITCPARVPYPHPRCKEGTWISLSRTLADPRSNITNRSGENLHDFQIYVFAYYYTATTLVGCGFGDFLPANPSERRYTAVMFFMYIFGLAYLLASVVGSKCHLDYKLLKYQQDMNYLLGYLKREQVNVHWTRSMIRYYDYQWLRTKGIEPQRLFYDLFPALRKEVTLSVFEDVMRRLPGLKNAPVHFIRDMCVHLSPIYFMQENTITRQDDLCDRVYFLFRGTVAIIHNGITFAVLNEEGSIGNINPFAVNATYDTTSVALTNVDLFAIKKEDFNRVVASYPRVASSFASIAAEISRRIESVTEDFDMVRKNISKRRKRQRPNRMKILKKSPAPIKDLAQRSQRAAKKIMELNKNLKHKAPPSKTINEEDRVFTPLPKDDQYYYTYTSSLPEIQEISITEELFSDDPDISPMGNAFTEFILTESVCIRLLNNVVFIAANLSVGLVSYQAAFQDTRLVLFAIGFVCDAVYLLKMCMTFRISYIDDFGDIVLDNSEIENRYLSNPFGFAWDFVSTFPFEIFTQMAPASIPELQFLSLLRLNRLLRISQAWTFFGIKRCPSGVLINLFRMKLIRLLSLTGIYLHLAACVLQTYTVHLNCGECSLAITNDTWLHSKKAVEGGPINHPYVFTLYFILSAFTTTAYGDVTPVTKFEMLFISFIAISSKVWLGLALSDILSGLQNTTDITYHLAAQGVIKLYNDYGVSPDLQEKTKKYFNHAWVQNKGVITPQYLIRAPANMKLDMCSIIYGGHFRKSYLFRELSESFIRHACIRIKHVYVISGDYIIHEKEIDNAIYFVHRGFVMYRRTIMNKDGDTKEEEGLLSKYRYFGESQGLLGPQPHAYSYKADGNADVARISNTDFEELFEMFPEHKETVLSRLRFKILTAANEDPFQYMEAKPPEVQEYLREEEEEDIYINNLP